MAIFTILYSNYYPPYGEFKLICMRKFSTRTWVNFTQQYGKNRQRCQQNPFYHAVWHLLLYFYREFPSEIPAEMCTVERRNLTRVNYLQTTWPWRRRRRHRLWASRISHVSLNLTLNYVLTSWPYFIACFCPYR